MSAADDIKRLADEAIRAALELGTLCDGAEPANLAARAPLFAAVDAFAAERDELLTAARRAVLALAFAAESSEAMRDDYDALSAAISRATEGEQK